MPVRGLGEVQPKEAVVHLNKSVGETGELVEVLADELGLVNLLVEGVVACGVVAHAVAERSELFINGPAGLKQLVGDTHHDGDGLDHRAIEGYQYGEGEQAPEAAAHGADLFLSVETGHLLVEFLRVALVLLLQLHHAGLEPGHAHHALLALGHEGQHDQRDGQ